MKLPVFKAIGMTFAFVAQHWLDLVKIMWLPMAVLFGVMVFFLPGYMQTTLSLMELGSQPDPEQALAAVSAMLPLMLLIMLVSIAVYLIVFAGILKLLIHGEKPSLPFYIGFGSDELRLLGTGALYVVIFIGLEIAVGLAAGLVGGLGMAVPGVGPIIAIVAACAALVVFTWVNLRLSLASPAAVGARAIGIGPSWKATRGNVWPLLGYWLIWILLLAVVEVILLLIIMPEYFQGMAAIFSASGSGSPAQVEEASRAMTEAAMAMYDLSSPLAIVRLVAGFLIGFVILAISVVSGGVAWRLITEESPEKHF